MKVGDQFLQTETGSCGVISNIFLASGDEVEEVDEAHHDLISAVVFQCEDGMWVAVQLGPGDIVPMDRRLH